MTTEITTLPSYDQLPIKDGAPEGSAWGLFGDEDQLGCLNLLTPERVATAARLVRRGAVFPLNWRIDQPDPPLFGRGAPSVHLLEIGGGVARDDYIDNFYPQASSQWDGLRHIRHPRDGFYNGVRDEEVIEGEGGKLGMENFARKGIVGRGVLLDVGRHLESRGTPLDCDTSAVITKNTLDACAKAQDISIQTGDILLIRTGWLCWYMKDTTAQQRQTMAGDAMTQLRAPGIGPAEEMAEYLWNLHVAAVAGDNPSLEAWPPSPESGFLHFKMLPHFGMPIGEMWDMEALAAECAQDGVYEFMFTSAPLNVPGGVGSPPNALEIK